MVQGKERGFADGIRQARVIDMSVYLSGMERKLSVGALSKELGCSTSTVHQLMAKQHWQQNPTKVSVFNTLRDATINEETGIPTGEDLLKFGGLSPSSAGAGRGVAEQDIRRVSRALGLGDTVEGELVRRMHVLNGAEVEVPGRFDTQAFLALNEERLWLAYKALDTATIAKASPKDLVSMISMLVEKRQLLKGEPTSIVRSEHRGDLARVSALLLAEMRRRGLQTEEPAVLEAGG